MSAELEDLLAHLNDRVTDLSSAVTEGFEEHQLFGAEEEAWLRFATAALSSLANRGFDPAKCAELAGSYATEMMKVYARTINNTWPWHD